MSVWLLIERRHLYLTTFSNIKLVSNKFQSLQFQCNVIVSQETQGVCVATYGQTKAFPAFFTRDSGSKSPYNVNNVRDAAKLVGKSFIIYCLLSFGVMAVEGLTWSLF